MFIDSSGSAPVLQPAGWFSATFRWPDVLKATKRGRAVIILCGDASDTRLTCCDWQHIYSLSLHISQQANCRVISSNWKSSKALLFLFTGYDWVCRSIILIYHTSSFFKFFFIYIRFRSFLMSSILMSLYKHFLTCFGFYFFKTKSQIWKWWWGWLI